MNNSEEKKVSICEIFKVLSIIFIAVGVFTIIICSVPIYLFDYREYVGGDAYNIQIAATMRSGYISAGAILIGSGMILLFLSLKNKFENNNIKKDNNTDNLPKL